LINLNCDLESELEFGFEFEIVRSSYLQIVHRERKNVFYFFAREQREHD